jgi:hypothetical protein
VDELQDRVAVPELAMLVGLIASQVRPDGTVSVRLTVPVNPLSAVMVIVEDAEVPTVVEGDVAEIEKSVIVNVAVAVWVSVPLVPVIVRLYVPAVVELQETVTVPELVTLVELMAPQVRPEGTVSVRLTVPVNPLRAVTVIVDVAEVPTVTAVGEVAAIVKSVTAKVAVVEWLRVPLMPVIVRV